MRATGSAATRKLDCRPDRLLFAIHPRKSAFAPLGAVGESDVLLVTRCLSSVCPYEDDEQTRSSGQDVEALEPAFDP